MSWYKKTSRNIDINRDLEIDAIDIAADVVKNWPSFKSSTQEYINYRVTYRSKYTDEDNSVIFAFFETKKNKNVIATYDEMTNLVTFFPENLIHAGIVKTFDDPKVIEIIASYIMHEITHNVDPKRNLPDYRQRQEEIKEEQDKGNTNAYYRSPTEFDAYSKQISYDIRLFAYKNDKNKEMVLEWLRSNNFDNLFSIIDRKMYEPFLTAISASSKNLKILKQRILNELNS